jgi:predicted nucleic acid-binding protein
MSLLLDAGVLFDLQRGAEFLRRWGPRRGLDAFDALVAAAAQAMRLVLVFVTRNARHFPMISDLKRPYA